MQVNTITNDNRSISYSYDPEKYDFVVEFYEEAVRAGDIKSYTLS